MSEYSGEVYKQLNRTHTFAMNDQAADCERHRVEQGDRIRNFREHLVKSGIIDPVWSKVYIDDCVLQSEWSGVLDFRDKATDPKKIMTKPSLGWTCQPLECHIEGDLPVPLDKKDDTVKRVTALDKCCVDITHIHEDPVSPEAHVHVVCKGIHPSDLGIEINQLAKLVLRQRGYEVE